MRADQLELGKDRVVMGLEAPARRARQATKPVTSLLAGEPRVLHDGRARTQLYARIRAAARSSACRRLDQRCRAGTHERRSGPRSRSGSERHRVADRQAPDRRALRRPQMVDRAALGTNAGRSGAAGRSSGPTHRPGTARCQILYWTRTARSRSCASSSADSSAPTATVRRCSVGGAVITTRASSHLRIHRVPSRNLWSRPSR